MKIWIDQEACTGDGLCEEIAPELFQLADDGLAYVLDDGKALDDPGGPSGIVAVPERFEDDVVEAAESCPGECIFIEA